MLCREVGLEEQHYSSIIHMLVLMYSPIACSKIMKTLYIVYAVHLVVILIWRLGRSSSDRQIKITANTVVLSEVLINSNDE